MYIYKMGLQHGRHYAIAVDTEVDKRDLDPGGWKFTGLFPFYWTYGLDQLDVAFLIKHIHDLK